MRITPVKYGWACLRLAILLGCAAGFVASDPPAARAATYEVNANNVFFAPASITIQPSDTVRWVPVAGAHTVTSEDGWFNSGGTLYAPYEFTFSEPGMYAYYCYYHPGMVGEVVVSGAATPTHTAQSSSTPEPEETKTAKPSATVAPTDTPVATATLPADTPTPAEASVISSPIDPAASGAAMPARALPGTGSGRAGIGRDARTRILATLSLIAGVAASVASGATRWKKRP
ncbi:MAG: plastocyanin/azurin family copper-binding protein [Dehalococcoidia bacterium]